MYVRYPNDRRRRHTKIQHTNTKTIIYNNIKSTKIVSPPPKVKHVRNIEMCVQKFERGSAALKVY